ncbi:MAG: hypothetical protein ACRD4Y_16610 [Candidatus Acidiferrales bacterium]
MSMINRALEANRKFGETDHPALGKHPAPDIAVETCLDPRLSDPAPGPGEVPVRVAASGLNPIDYKRPHEMP